MIILLDSQTHSSVGLEFFRSRESCRARNSLLSWHGAGKSETILSRVTQMMAEPSSSPAAHLTPSHGLDSEPNISHLEDSIGP